MIAQVNYDGIALHYQERYKKGSELMGVAETIRNLAAQSNAQKILEIGCGTGRWLNELQILTSQVYGLDFSLGMLQQAKDINNSLSLTRGNATTLPFQSSTFDLLLCLFALHHFPDPIQFIAEASRILVDNGTLIIVNMDPHQGVKSWYIYDYFSGTRETDRHRFPSTETIKGWMREAGFKRIESQVVDMVKTKSVGREILGDHFLQKYGTSQLALLSDEAYNEGMRKIESAIAAAERRNEVITFTSEIDFFGVIGYL